MVAVIIAAWHAEATVAMAVASALAEPETAEVIVVDDASTDGTVAAARAADDGSGRLRVLRQETRQGPSAARNRAIAESAAPLIAILDADDFFLPGRLAALLAQPEWDMIGDDIVFIPEAMVGAFDPRSVRKSDGTHELIDLARFIAGNLSRRRHPRGELGFLKPVIRRSFLERTELRYDPAMWLGEDYSLYARMLVAGARFVCLRRCGYAAIKRSASLSGRHATNDLKALLDFDDVLLTAAGLDPSAVAPLRRHRRQLANRYAHRRFLDLRRERGFGAAIGEALSDPLQLGRTTLAVLRDKLGERTWSKVKPKHEVRYLFT